jgi:uncharacterized integral membrane protein (TIGR00698 family)
MMLTRTAVWRRNVRFSFSSSLTHACSSSIRDYSAVPKDDEKQREEPLRQMKVAPFFSSESVKALVPGVALSAVTAGGGFAIASAVSTALAMPLSGIPVAILLGMGIQNTVGCSDIMKPGITFATKTVLQGGIVAVAAKLSFVELLTTGSQGLPVVIGAVGAGLMFIPMAGRMAGLPREMSLLLTAGTSICGVTAITALAPAIKAQNRDLAVAVANTVAFGTIGMLVYPYVFHALCSSSEQVGMCLGVAIHDTSQVLGSAMSYKETFDDEVALKVAAITKLTRNLGLAFAIPGLTYLHAMEEKKEMSDADKPVIGGTISGLNTFQKYVPTFLLAFIGMASLRSTGDFILGSDFEAYNATMDFVGNDVSKYALGTAMAGVGLSTSASSLKGVGWKPFAVGASGALVVGGTGFTIASLLV